MGPENGLEVLEIDIHAEMRLDQRKVSLYFDFLSVAIGAAKIVNKYLEKYDDPVRVRARGLGDTLVCSDLVMYLSEDITLGLRIDRSDELITLPNELLSRIDELERRRDTLFDSRSSDLGFQTIALSYSSRVRQDNLLVCFRVS